MLVKKFVEVEVEVEEDGERRFGLSESMAG